MSGYLLLERDTIGSSDAVQYLNNTLVSRIKSGTLPLTRVVLAFANPSMNPKDVMASTDPELIVQAAGLMNANTGYKDGDGKAIAGAIAALKAIGVETYLSVGGWAYSCYDSTKMINGIKDQGMCAGNWPLTKDIGAEFVQANLRDDIHGQVQPFDENYTEISSYTDAWAHAAKALGCAGVDMDAEEYWFASQATYLFPKLVKNPTFAKIPAGPFALPYSVIKYAATLKALKTSANAAGLGVSIAAPAVAAFDIHDHLGSSAYWCAIFDSNGQQICGQSKTSGHNYKPGGITVGGNLKGILYDMANYTGVNAVGYKWKYDDEMMKGLFDGIDSIGIMSYDLDDGDDTVKSSWCVGVLGANHFASRDPTTNGDPSGEYLKLDCAIPSQVAALTQQFKQNIAGAAGDSPPLLQFGIENGFPNFPINLDKSLPGGGTSGADTTSDRFRWNDPWAPLDVPLKESASAADISLINGWRKKHQESFAYKGKPDVHSSVFQVNEQMFTKMKTAGADGMMLWALYNPSYMFNFKSADCTWSDCAYDVAQAAKGNTHYFADAIAKYGWTMKEIEAVLNNAASDEDIIQAANKYMK